MLSVNIMRGIICVLVCLVLVESVVSKPFNVYWNVPTCTCQKLFNITFTQLAKEFGINMNDDDEFRGNQVSILYSPGLAPKVYNYSYSTYNHEEDYGKLYFVNEGIPQMANFLAHLDAFEVEVNAKVPDKHNTGLIIIDLEDWGATWAQNFNNMEIYRILSRLQVQLLNPFLSTQEVEQTAALEYERAALSFLERTLRFGQCLRPKAKWGYYQYPQCFNPLGVDYCSETTKHDNDQMIQIWRRSDALYPSLYLGISGSVEERAAQIRGKVREAHRVSLIKNDTMFVIPYISTYYYTGEQVLVEDLENLIKIPKEEGADGIVIWGAYSDYNTFDKCTAFKEYFTNVLGPIAKKYITVDTDGTSTKKVTCNNCRRNRFKMD